MSHANAALTPRQRLRVARLIIDQGWPVSRAAELFNCSWPTAKRWAQRYAAMGEPGMTDRSSSPHRVANRTPQQLVRKVVHLRWKQRLGPVAIGAYSGRITATFARNSDADPDQPTRSASVAAGIVGVFTNNSRTLGANASKLDTPDAR